MLPDYLMKSMREDIASSIIAILKRDLDFEHELKLEGLIGITVDYQDAILLNLSRPDFHLPRRVLHDSGDCERQQMAKDTEKYDWKATLRANRSNEYDNDSDEPTALDEDDGIHIKREDGSVYTTQRGRPRKDSHPQLQPRRPTKRKISLPSRYRDQEDDVKEKGKRSGKKTAKKEKLRKRKTSGESEENDDSPGTTEDDNTSKDEVWEMKQEDQESNDDGSQSTGEASRSPTKEATPKTKQGNPVTSPSTVPRFPTRPGRPAKEFKGVKRVVWKSMLNKEPSTEVAWDKVMKGAFDSGKSDTEIEERQTELSDHTYELASLSKKPDQAATGNEANKEEVHGDKVLVEFIKVAKDTKQVVIPEKRAVKRKPGRRMKSAGRVGKKLKQYCCEECGKVMPTAKRMWEHRRLHTGVKPYLCQECGRAFSTRGNFSKHLKIHAGVKDFECEICGKDFMRKGGLLEHMLVHNKVMRYKCETCGKGFFRADKCRDHQMVHTGEKPFLCGVCGRGFTQRGNLKTHQKVHLNKRLRAKADKAAMDMGEMEVETELATEQGEAVIYTANLQDFHEVREVEGTEAQDIYNATEAYSAGINIVNVSRPTETIIYDPNIDTSNIMVADPNDPYVAAIKAAGIQATQTNEAIVYDPSMGGTTTIQVAQANGNIVVYDSSMNATVAQVHHEQE